MNFIFSDIGRVVLLKEYVVSLALIGLPILLGLGYYDNTHPFEDDIKITGGEL